MTILDVGCGVGGTSIGFARQGKRVIAVDVEGNRLEMAKFNAALFGVRDKIEFVNADFREILFDFDFDTLHLDLDWGGPSYRSREKFTVSDFVPDGREALRLIAARTSSVIFKVPKNFAFDTLPDPYQEFLRIKMCLGSELLHYYLVREQDLIH